MAITVREAVADDAAILVSLVHQFKRQESESAAKLTVEGVLTHGFGERARFHVLLAEDAGRAVG